MVDYAEGEMNAKVLTRVILVTLIVAMLGGAYVIVARNGAGTKGANQETPSGFMH